MDALVLTQYNQLDFTKVETPLPGKAEVLVRIKAVGICGSDIHGIDGSTGRRVPPIIMGHEAAGVVEAIGQDVAKCLPGDRVTFDSTIYCGECQFCRRGEINFCENRKVFGVSCDEYSQQGAFSQYVVVPERIIYHLPDDVTFHQATMIEPLSVAMHAVSITSYPIGASAVIYGGGVIGLLVLKVLLSAGCSRVFVVDIDQSRLDFALHLGAEAAFNSKETGVLDEISSLTDGMGTDLAIDVVGVQETFGNAVHSVKKGGQVTVIGNFSANAELPLQYIVSHQITIKGSNASAGEYPACIQMIKSGQIQVDQFISVVAPLSEGESWLKRLYKGEAGLFKVLLEP